MRGESRGSPLVVVICGDLRRLKSLNNLLNGGAGEPPRGLGVFREGGGGRSEGRSSETPWLPLTAGHASFHLPHTQPEGKPVTFTAFNALQQKQDEEEEEEDAFDPRLISVE